jgi:uncharacterized NAD(P)/FAD-binding protein YdhS
MCAESANVSLIAIIGAGFSGTAVAVQLARQSAGRPLRVVIVEPSGKFGAGVAYGTRCTRHILNVPAGNMSALPEEPNHFVEWTRRHGISDSPDAFVPRYWYGVYLHDLLEEARHSSATIERLAARVVDLIPIGEAGASGARLILEGGREMHADRVVIAGGNFRPAVDPLLAEIARYVRNPWQPGALESVGDKDEVLMIGTGLTMLDVVVQLRSAGHRGRVHALSRRGLLPQPHRPPKHHKVIPMPREVVDAPRTAKGLLRGVRGAIKRLSREGIDWRDVIASLRQHTVALWTSLGERERGKFLRHVRPFWDTHRHRIPLDLVDEFERFRRDGTLVIHRGRTIGAESKGDGVRVRIQPRDRGDAYELNVEWVVNCTGPESDIRKVEDPLWSNLRDRGIAKADAFGLGVVTTSHGTLVGVDGNACRSIYLVGPLRKAQLWEATAVPELRVLAADVARFILSELEIPAADTDPSRVVPEPVPDSDDFIPIYAGEHI